MDFTVGDMKDWATCKQKFEWTSKLRRGLSKERDEYVEERYLGRMIHTGLEAHYEMVQAGSYDESYIRERIDYEMKKWVDDVHEFVWENNKEEVEEATEKGIQIVHNYADWAEEKDADWDEILLIEKYQKVQIPGTTNRLIIYPDIVFRKNNGQTILMEHKTGSTKRSREMELEQQMVAYAWGVRRAFDIEVDKIVFNKIRRDLPTEPKVNKSGHLSKAKIRTTEKAFKQAIKEHYENRELNPGDRFDERLQELKEQDNPFFDRSQQRIIQDAEIEDMEERLRKLSEFMRQHEQSDVFPNYGCGECDWCPVREPCIAKRQGSDYQTLLEEEYEQKDYMRDSSPYSN